MQWLVNSDSLHWWKRHPSHKWNFMWVSFKSGHSRNDYLRAKSSIYQNKSEQNRGVTRPDSISWNRMLLAHKFKTGIQTSGHILTINTMHLIITPVGGWDCGKGFPFLTHSGKNMYAFIRKNPHLVSSTLQHQTHASLLKFLLWLTFGIKIWNGRDAAVQPASECGQGKWNLSSHQQYKSLTFDSREGKEKRKKRS